MARKVKAALIRDPSVPAGQSAPLHVVCECGQNVPIDDERNVCGSCRTVYDGAGWIKGRE